MNLFDYLRKHPMWIGVRPLIGAAAIPVSICGALAAVWHSSAWLANKNDRMANFHETNVAILKMLEAWANSPSWWWSIFGAFVVVFLISAYVIGYRIKNNNADNIAHREKELDDFKNLIRQATEIPNLMAREAKLQKELRELSGFLDPIIAANCEVKGTFLKMKNRGEPVDFERFDTAISKPCRRFANRLSSVVLAEVAPRFQYRSLPTLPKFPLVPTAGSVDLDRNKESVDLLFSFLEATEEFLRDIRRYRDKEKEELKELSSKIRSLI